MADYRDLVIAMLADSEAELRAHLSEREREVAVLRDLVHAALDELHALTRQNHRLRACLRRDLRQPCGRVQTNNRRAA